MEIPFLRLHCISVTALYFHHEAAKLCGADLIFQIYESFTDIQEQLNAICRLFLEETMSLDQIEMPEEV